MNNWIIEGVDKTTGKERTMRLSAETADDAGAKARMSGMLIERIRPDAPPIAASTGTRATTHAGAVPDYWALGLAGSLSTAFGVVCIAIGVVFLVVVIVVMTTRPEQLPGPGSIAIGVAGFLAYSLAGVLIAAIGQACHALRDIARNSWK